jgi:hypothetical protein
MIAPDTNMGKGKWISVAASSRARDIYDPRHHGFVSRIILLPNCRQARAQLKWELDDWA